SKRANGRRRRKALARVERWDLQRERPRQRVLLAERRNKLCVRRRAQLQIDRDTAALARYFQLAGVVCFPELPAELAGRLPDVCLTLGHFARQLDVALRRIEHEAIDPQRFVCPGASRGCRTDLQQLLAASLDAHAFDGER